MKSVLKTRWQAYILVRASAASDSGTAPLNQILASIETVSRTVLAD